MSAHTRATSLL